MLFNGERRRKDDSIFQALGDTDELNASIGVARAHCEALVTSMDATSAMLPQLDSVQSRLLDIGSAIATPRSNSSEAHLRRANFDEGGALALELEAWMDAMDSELPPLRNFILPSGGTASASLHVARAVCRRAERSVVPLCLDGARPSSAASMATVVSPLKSPHHSHPSGPPLSQPPAPPPCAGECDASAAIYLNRLSDYLFVGARYVAVASGRADVEYKKGRTAGAVESAH